jgi:hypothetical protein
MKGTLPGWVERLLGVDAAEAGEGTVWSLDYSWGWAPWLTLLFVLGCMALIFWVNLREGKTVGRGTMLVLALTRLAAVAVVMLMLAELVLSRERTGLPYVVVAVDDSASMGIVDRYSDQELRSLLRQRLEEVGLDDGSRLNLAKSLLLREDAALLRGIEREYKLRLYLVAASARAQIGTLDEQVAALRKMEPTGEASRLGAGIRVMLDDLRGTPPTAVILLSDGINTEGDSLREAAAYARRKNVPLFTVALGSEDAVRNLKLQDLLVDENVFVNDVVNFEFKLVGHGLEGREVRVSLKEADDDKTLASMKVRIGDDGLPEKHSLPYRPTQVGDFRYVVEVENLAEEDQSEDNREERQVSVHKGQIKVLLVQSYPNFEYRYLKHMLERDSTIILRTVLQEADLEYASQDPSALSVFPVRRDKLSEEDDGALFFYDCILFGDVNPAFLSSVVMKNLSDFVQEQGRGIVFIAGPLHTPLAYRDTPLASLFPLDLSSAPPAQAATATTEAINIRPTDLGLVSPHMQLGDTADQTREVWSNLPGVYWTHEVPALRPAARVLAEHPTKLNADGQRLPIFTMQYVGKGKVLFHATDETWRWRFRVGDVFFARYWVQTLRYLARSKLRDQDSSAELTVDRREYRRGEPVRLRLQFFDERNSPADDDGVTVVVERPGQKNRELTLRRNPTNRGVFEGVLPDAADGTYHARVAVPSLPGGAPAADFSVVAPPGEFKTVQMDMAELKAAAQQTNGHYYTIATSDRLLNDLPEGRQVPIETLEPIVLWNKWPLVFVFVGLLVTEWIVRKRKGLL